MANIGHPQARNGKLVEDGMVTSGNDLTKISRFLQPGASTYTAAEVIADLMRSVAPDRSGDAARNPVAPLVCDGVDGRQ